MLKNGVMTLLFAFIPGAGQMYQGYMKRGLSLISVCCAGFLLGLMFPPLLVLPMIVWMYSFFDTLNLRAQLAVNKAPEDDYLFHLDVGNPQLAKLGRQSHKLLGWGLILLGVMLFYEEFIMNTVGSWLWRLAEYSSLCYALYRALDRLPEVMVCIALVVCGGWLVRGPRKPDQEKPEDAIEFLAYRAVPDSAPAPDEPAREDARTQAGPVAQAVQEAAGAATEEGYDDDREAN